MTEFDLAIIGSGPGGYVAGLYASRHNLKVCVIEQGLVGGTCLNRGCIPTKSLINSASVLSTVKNAGTFGVAVDSYAVDFGKMMSRKDEVVLRLRTGIETLLRANNITLVRGKARLTGPETIDVEKAGGIKASNIIIAAGSKVASLPGLPIDEEGCLSSDGILNLKRIPASLVIVGGGVIGCEFAGLFNALGSKVTVVEMVDRLLSGQSREASKKLETIFKKNGIDLLMSAKVASFSKGGLVRAALSTGGSIEAEKVLVSIGRASDTSGLGLEAQGIETRDGKIAVGPLLRTSIKSIYAIGDCIAGPQLAHKASYDAMLAVDAILGRERPCDYSNIPNCIWTEPEIASVGLNEEEAKARFPDAKVAKFPYLASGKAFLEGRTEGFVKIVGTPAGEILGVEIFGKGACDLISEAALARTMKITIKDWCRAVHAHPTLSEAIQEAAHIFTGTPIHSI